MPYEPGVLEVAVGCEVGRLATAEHGTTRVVCDDFEHDDWLISRIWLEDETGTAVPCIGQEVDVTRAGWRLMAAGSEGVSTGGAFTAAVVPLGGQGALAVYHRV